MRDVVPNCRLSGPELYGSPYRAQRALMRGAMSFLRGEYDAVSPDGPEHFPVVFEKMMAMLAREPEIDLASLSAVAVPTLVTQGDRDDVRLAHSAAVASALPDARLAVLPGSHALPIENPLVVNALIVSFLRER